MKKLYFFCFLFCLLGFSNRSFGFTTYYYPTSATVTGGGTSVCQGGPASPLTCTVPTSGYSVFLGGGGPSVLVTYTWYYNTTGSVVSGTPVPGYVGLTYTAGAAAQILTLPSAAISTATIGTFYYYVILTGTNTADGSFSPINITSNTQTITVTAPTSSILGPSTLCSGSTITLTDSSPGGTWSSSAPGVATVTTGGVVTGVGAGGTATITYAGSGGCNATKAITVNPLPATISGTPVLCAGTTTTLTDLTGAGTWTSSNPLIATVGSSSGVVSGLAGGTTTIVFSLTSTGCSTSEVVTVNPAAAPITGTQTVCVGQNTTLADLTTGGAWSSSAPGIASVTGGVVTGVSAGTATISYALGTGCSATVVVTVNALPPAITGSATVCHTYTTTLADGGGAGTWTSSNPGIAPVGATTGVVTGSGLGSATITYALAATGCYTTYNETVNPLPSPIQGPASLCANASVTLSDTTLGGTWVSGTPGSAAVGPTGIVSGVAAGSTTITYTLGTGCFVTQTETVLPFPAPITGDSMVCSGSAVTESDITAGSTWSLTGTGATIGTTTGIITATLSGATPVVDTVRYTITATGCRVSRPVTVNPLPSAIAGIRVICDSSTTNLFNTLPGGIWTSSTPAIATINSVTGVAFGWAPGIDNITYTIPTTGCVATTTLTVAPPPAPISGLQTVCPMLTTTLSDGISSGTWISGSPSVATIGASTGIITGIMAGTTVITYELGVCSTTEVVTVNPLPAVIGGPNFVCTGGATITLTDATPAGSWSSTNPSIAPINSVSGVLTGMGTGTATITYQLIATGCYQTENITIEPLPGAITGPDSVCLGGSVTLADPASGGSFSSGTPSIAGVSASSGVVTGASVGATQITYTLSGTGCQISMPFHVNPILPVSNMLTNSLGDTICAGNTEMFTSLSVNGGTAPVYQWVVNGAVITGATSASYSYNPGNGDVIKCILTSNATCAQPATVTSNAITMVVNPVTNPTVTMSPGNHDTICVGTSTTFNVVTTSGGSSPVYLWSVNWMPVGAGTTSYSYTPANGDIVRCGMISSSPCPVPDTAFAIDTMIVEPYQTPLVSIDGASGLAACQGNFVTLTANRVWGGWGPVYNWTVNGLPVTATGNTYSYMPGNNDVVAVTMNSNYPCTVPSASASSQTTITVNPVITVTITDVDGGLVTSGTFDTLIANVTNGGTNPIYQWFRNGTPIPGGNYYKLALNDFVNTDSISCDVITNGSAACDGIRGHAWLVLQVAPERAESMHNAPYELVLKPNPNAGSFLITGKIADGSRLAHIEVTNMMGQKVYNGDTPVVNGVLKAQLHLDPSLPSGMYLVRVGTGKNATVSGINIVK